MEIEEVQEVLAALAEEKVDYAIFGAMAMNLHGLVRATEDIDLFVRPDAANIERLKAALGRVYDDPTISDIDVREMLGDYPSIRYGPPDSDLYFDILTRLGEAVSWDDLHVETILFEGVPARVVSPATLYRLKRGTIRPQDRVDAQRIRDRFQLEEG